MATLQDQLSAQEAEEAPPLNFPPLTKSHILHCSYHYWHPKYRSITPKARLIPLSKEFVHFLRADGIVLPPEDTPNGAADDDWALSDYGSDQEDQEQPDPSTEWPEVHDRIKRTLSELGGKVAPKLNWSAPKDATWMNATNSMACTTPNDIYLLLKSSNFITHDLDHAFDDCAPEPTAKGNSDDDDIPYHLVLRKFVDMNPSVEFRCFVRNRRLLCICQRDTAHYAFLHDIQNDIRNEIQDFFDDYLMDTFPDPNFVFDVYVPAPHKRVWLVDINPWASKTDPVLFNWRDILEMEGPTDEDDRYMPEGMTLLPPKDPGANGMMKPEDMDLEYIPWFMLVGADGPSGLGLLQPQYSAHKLPKDVVDASCGGTGGMSEFLGQWQDILEKRIQEDKDYKSEEDE